MIQSKFNVYREYAKGKYWLYNTFTTSVVILDDDSIKKYFIDENFSDENDIISELHDMGFFIDDSFDELKYLESLRRTVVDSNKKIVDLMIAPTMDCNARCYYCFEHGCHHEKMTKETADAVVSYIINNWNGELFNISWFGGEPLLATDVMDYISRELERKSINFISKITTNGYELSESTVRHALNHWHTNKIQISIDALHEEYNRIKNYKGVISESPFDKVLANVRTALESGIKIRIRINFNPIEKSKASELMDYLQVRFSAYENFSCYFAPIDTKSSIVPSIAGKFDSLTEHPFLSLIKLARKYGYYAGNNRDKNKNYMYDDKGFLSALKLYPSPTNCYASCPSMFAIDSKGDLYKCHRVLGKGEQYSSGNVRTGIIKNDIYNFFCNTDLSYDECKDCKILPICQGGCKINAYVYNDEHACSPIKSIYKELIELYLISIHAI